MANTSRRRSTRRKTEAEVDRGAELARRAGEATRAAWTGTARGAGRLARRLPSPHRTPGVDQPGHDTAGLVLLLTGLLVAAAEWTNPAGLPGRILDMPAAVTGGLFGGLGRARPAAAAVAGGGGDAPPRRPRTPCGSSPRPPASCWSPPAWAGCSTWPPLAWAGCSAGSPALWTAR